MQDSGTLDHSTHDDPPADAVAVVDQGLGAANDEAAPLHEVRRLGCFVRDASGSVIGGAVGRTWGAACELQQLWVAPEARGRGIGSDLVRRFEQHALARGCTLFYLDTWSFQAPAFYEKLGYRSALALDGIGPGLSRHVMTKTVAPVA
jgi:GNAT superfamily N-acetyltransferase